MLAGVRNVAWGAAIAMAGFLAVMLAEYVWIVLFWSDAGARYFFGPRLDGFGQELFIGAESMMMVGATSLLGLAVAIWLITYAIRRATRWRCEVR